MSAADRHPDLLAYVASLLPETQQAEVAAHLRRCDSCREEEHALRSLRRSLRSTTAGGHPSVEDLVEVDAGAPRGSLSGHLARCAECRADLEALARVRHSPHGERDRQSIRREGESFQRDDEDAAPFRPRGARRIARSVLAAGLAASLLGVGWQMVRPHTSARRSGPDTEVLTPATRGEVGARAIAAGGPARLRVALPFGAPAGRYEARLQDASGLDLVTQTSIVKDGEVLEVRFDAPDRPGEYHLAVQSLEMQDAAPTVYRLRVVAGAPASPR